LNVFKNSLILCLGAANAMSSTYLW